MKKLINKKNISFIIDALSIIVGTFLMGTAFNVFLNSKNISPSGFSGLCALVSNILAKTMQINIPASILYLIVNGVLFVFAYKNMGLKFAINSAIGIISYSVFMQVCNFNIGLAGDDLLLCAIYGGVVMGVGLGFVFRGHGSTGGSDMLANILSKRFRFITVGNMVFIVNFIVVALTFVAYNNLNLALYSLIAIYILTKMSDIMVSGVSGLRAYYIISSHSEKIAQTIMRLTERGVTGFKSQGMYTHNEQNVLMTVVTRAEVSKLRQIVAKIDKDAFMFSSPISEAMGSRFMPINPTNKKDNKENDVE